MKHVGDGQRNAPEVGRRRRGGGWWAWGVCAGIAVLGIRMSEGGELGQPPVSPASAPSSWLQSSLRPWSEYRVILWMGESFERYPEKRPQLWARLRELGVDTGMVHGGGGDGGPFIAAGLPYYVENLVNRGLCLKWNSGVRDWEKFVTEWAAGGRSEAAMVREYGLDDPAWLSWAEDQMREAARRHGPKQPLAYDIRDELSVTISANPFDYDFSPVTLAALREWLRTQYADVGALNREWETRFEEWEAVRPFTTDQIKARMASGEARGRGQPDWGALQRLRFEPELARRERTRWNFAPWADFRTYMDLSLARALDRMRRAARAVDPSTPVGIEGTQMPHAFGGYDLWRLSQAVDWVEPYDIGGAREILGSFMPEAPLMATVFEEETRSARRRLWHLLFEGDRGCIIWWSEDCLDWGDAALKLTAKARNLAPVLQELKSPLARVFLRARRVADPIALVYSQPSVQVNWLLESMRDGSTWVRRFSSFEADHNRMAQVRLAWLKVIQDLGYSPRFLPVGDLARPERLAGLKALVLPTVLALADAEADGVRTYLREGRDGRSRVVLADGAPGLFDAHGRLRERGCLEDWVPAATSESGCFVLAGTGAGGEVSVGRRSGDLAGFQRARLAQPGGVAVGEAAGWAEWVGNALGGVPREVEVPAEARVRVHRFELPPYRLLAFERNIAYQMSEELKQAGGNEALEVPVTVTARLNRAAHVLDLRRGVSLGKTDRITWTLDPWEPSLFALSEAAATVEEVQRRAED